MVKNNIVLMSGKGQRFKDEGYKIPKPLIDLHGKPIIEKVINNFPNTDKWIFTVNKEVYEHETFIKFYEKFNLNKTILLLDEVTNGQATSCLKSLDLVPSGEDFFVGSCDAIFKNKIILNKNESTYIPLGTKHRLTNIGKNSLIIIEVQSGDYLGEDDIIRFKDKYGRG